MEKIYLIILWFDKYGFSLVPNKNWLNSEEIEDHFFAVAGRESEGTIQYPGFQYFMGLLVVVRR